ncbi:MAG TPA: aldo/keto reductase [Jeotgalicoccus sp.]|nr:aldo/keto reductase [Jeotgalicoccus sp.]
MKYIITKDNQSISRFSLGCMNLPLGNTKEIIDILRLALEFGVNFFDTADLYQYGRNEATVGPLLHDYKKHFDIKIGTKVGNEFDSALREKIRWNPSGDYINRAAIDSKLRLGTPSIDLYQLHGGTIEDNIDETIATFEELKRRGIIKSYGISSIRKNVIDYYKENSNIATLMTDLSILKTQGEEFLDESIVTLARGGLMQGLLSNKHENILEKKFKKGTNGYTYDELKQMLMMLTDYNHSLESIAFKYLDYMNVVTLNGVSSAKQLEQNIGHYLDAESISDDEIKEIRGNIKTLYHENHRE